MALLIALFEMRIKRQYVGVEALLVGIKDFLPLGPKLLLGLLHAVKEVVQLAEAAVLADEVFGEAFVIVDGPLLGWEGLTGAAALAAGVPGGDGGRAQPADGLVVAAVANDCELFEAFAGWALDQDVWVRAGDHDFPADGLLEVIGIALVLQVEPFAVEAAGVVAGQAGHVNSGHGIAPFLGILSGRGVSKRGCERAHIRRQVKNLYLSVNQGGRYER